ncbi:MAG: thioredoxin-disulfide reductase [Clostridia bacterium]|nr:thioredoxin-disulfide reductase [Clostridia bacterium]
MYDIIIVGAGPAGLTAAIYGVRANKKVLVLESKSYGGQIVNAYRIDNYPGMPHISGFEFATALYNQAKELGVEVKFETVIKIDKDKNVETTKNKYQAKAIILATGSENKTLNVENENKYIGKGISYCATCDGNFYRNKVVAVVGGGNTALEDALYLSNLAEKVYLIHRRDTFRGEEMAVDELRSKENVELVLNSNVVKLNGDSLIESIDVEDSEKNIRNIELNGLFIAVGRAPKNDIFSEVVKLDEKGYFESSDGIHTNVEGIYVAGDARKKELRQLATAIGDGANSATMAIKEMKN